MWVFVVLFLCAPFLLSAAVFIPALGQILVVIAAILSVTVLRIKRSIRVLFYALCGAASSGVFIASLIILNDALAPWVFYALLGGAVAVCTVYNVLLSAIIWLHYEQGGAQADKAGRKLE